MARNPTLTLPTGNKAAANFPAKGHTASAAQREVSMCDPLALPLISCEANLEVTPPCELSSPSFARCLAFSGPITQCFPPGVQLLPLPA